MPQKLQRKGQGQKKKIFFHACFSHVVFLQSSHFNQFNGILLNQESMHFNKSSKCKNVIFLSSCAAELDLVMAKTTSMHIQIVTN